MVCSLMVSRVYYIWYQTQVDSTRAYLGSKWIVLTSGMFSFLWMHGIPLGEGEWTLSSRTLTTRIKEILWEKGITKVVLGNWVNVVQWALGQQI